MAHLALPRIQRLALSHLGRRDRVSAATWATTVWPAAARATRGGRRCGWSIRIGGFVPEHRLVDREAVIGDQENQPPIRIGRRVSVVRAADGSGDRECSLLMRQR